MIDVDLIGAPAFAVDVVGDDFVYAGVNRRMVDLTGLRHDDVVGRSPRQCMPADVWQGVTERYRACVRAREAIASEGHHDLPAGGRWWHVILTPVFGQDGAVASLIGVATDTTDRRTIEREQREADARMALALDVLDGGFWHYDVATDALELSPKLSALAIGTAFPPGPPLRWADYARLVHPDDRIRIDPVHPVPPDGAADAEGGGTLEYRLSAADGDTRWLRCKRRIIRREGGQPDCVIGVVVDITEQHRLQDFYALQAVTDPLTGLGNRRGFECGAERLRHAAERDGSRFGLVLLDLDRLKPINDQYGHATGDMVLRELAARLRAQVRPGDVVARLGGDEFAILVADVTGGALPYLAQRLVLAAQQPLRTPVGELTIGISIGVATSLAGDSGIGDLAERADRALYEVKLSGRGAWKFAA